MYSKYKLRSRWSMMLSRCEDDDNLSFHNYGGRGIYVCEEWHNFNTFYEWCIANDFSQDFQLDRIDNDGPYSPTNCRFVSRSENSLNKRTTKMLTAFGVTKPIVKWIDDDRCLVTYDTIQARLGRGWSVEDAICIPAHSTRKKSGTPRQGKARYVRAGTIEAFGDSKGLAQWIEDERCLVKDLNRVWDRINNQMWSPEKAMTHPVSIKRKTNPNELFEAFGEHRTLPDWSRDSRCKVSLVTLRQRVRRGWDVDKSISKPA